MRKSDNKLRPVDPKSFIDLGFLYGVLGRRLAEPDTNISHRAMPTWSEHVIFIHSEPYRAHYLIEAGKMFAGVAYISKGNEIGIYVSPEFRGYGIAKWTLRQLLDKHDNLLPLFANINPRNLLSTRLFRSAGFVLHETHPTGGQITLKYGTQDR